eukprot:TRINITY_DN1801_c0_g2_i3.p1 TRINITY_DN1801_c0_g2~~TRINITY_DN1801_c0_g2_i3.p1  ORF type:complete len:424 (+),score=139.68 TRINITY_DN1801_c0_g2_i3:63-1334(+)
MQAQCEVLLDDSLIPHFCDEETLEKYSQKVLESYVEDNAFIKWCPSAPFCGHAMQITWRSSVDVDCVCGKSCCFACLKEPHQPCTCDHLKRWEKKCKDDSETANWIASNTKECPSCHKAVEKNGGCNHVSCKCGAFFCWLCGQETGRAHSWESIEGHTCGKYKEDAENRESQGRESLKRYMHYFERYQGHMQSLKFEKKLKDSVEAKRLHLFETTGQTMMDLSWMENGVKAIFECRRFLSHSYVYAFYMFSIIDVEDTKAKEALLVQKNLFEDQQQQLEGNIEKLAKLLETKESDIDQDVRRDTINVTSLVRRRCAALSDVIETQLEDITKGGTSNSVTMSSSSSSSSSSLEQERSVGSKQKVQGRQRGKNKKRAIGKEKLDTFQTVSEEEALELALSESEQNVVDIEFVDQELQKALQESMK